MARSNDSCLRRYLRPLAPWLPKILVLVVMLLAGDLDAQSRRAAGDPEKLPGTALLVKRGDLSTEMQEDVDRFMVHLTSTLAQPQPSAGDDQSLAVHLQSNVEKRKRFRQITGVVDSRVPFLKFELVAAADDPPLLVEHERFVVKAVRWPVLAGVTGEGLLLEPREPPTGFVIALPDADWTPEIVSGLQEGPYASADYARRLAAAGCRVLVPTLINRADTWSGNPHIRMLNQPHREFIYRPAFYLGRHIIGYEVQKVLAAVDYFDRENRENSSSLGIGVMGYGEGGLIAFYAAAIDERIDAALVSGYFQRRTELWREPIYRNVWGLLRGFGDAGIASLIAPRGLVVEASRGVAVDGPPPPREGVRNFAASGTLGTAPLQSVREEFSRAERVFRKFGVDEMCVLVESGQGDGPPGSSAALREFLRLIAVDPPAEVNSALRGRRPLDPTRAEARMKRQFRELVAFNQHKFWESSRKRAEFWRDADRSSLGAWIESTETYREYLLNHIIGDTQLEPVPPKPRTRLIYEAKTWNGYEVVLDVAPGLWAYGILLVPKSSAPTQRLPVVVAQHGRGGHPQDICDPSTDHRAYHRFGAKLADRGFVVFAPQNLYFGEEKYRLIQRKANPLGLSFFAPMVWQHRVVLRWLAGQPFVDPDRIAFYGLSYGGKSALLIPAVLGDYSLSICSGAFTDTVRKHIDAVGGNRSVFLFTNEYEHLEFDFAEKFNHAELAWLICPRPFMVEKGHWDGGLPDEWTGSEYARVRRNYARLGLDGLTEIEFFAGGHEINEEGTYEFLHRHLQHPRRSAR